MYTLLIADDEPLIRNGVKNIIDWESLGFSKILLAEDGQEALDLIRKNKVDLVLTDIVMPFMDGLELSKVLSEEFPEIHVVILTGHEDFEYAQQSVNLGVKNYILKPVGAQSLYKKMSEICKKLHIQNKQKEYISSMKKQLFQSMPVLRAQLLNRLVCMPDQNVNKQIERGKSLKLELETGPFEVALMDINLKGIPPEDHDLYMFAAKNITQECVGEEHYIFEDREGKLVILFRCSLFGDDAHDIVYQTLEVIQKAIFNNIQMKSTGAAGSLVMTAEELADSYNDAGRALECKYSLGGNSVYDIKDLNYLEKSFYYPVDELKELIGSIKFKGKEDIKEAVHRIVTAMNEGRNISMVNMKMIYIEIATSMLHELSGMKEVSSQIWDEGFAFYQVIDRLGTPEEMEEKLFQLAYHVRMEMKSLQSSNSMQVIDKVKEYVNQNYMDSELSLGTAAEFAAVSTGYLSGLFKKEAGTNFVKYLMDVRMEKSMELLKHTDMKTYEIAFETGFANPHYFSVAFKKYTGMSPSDFRMKE